MKGVVLADGWAAPVLVGRRAPNRLHGQQTPGSGFIFMNWAFLRGFASIGLTTRLGDLKAAGSSGFMMGFVVAGIKASLALAAVLLFIA